MEPLVKFEETTEISASSVPLDSSDATPPPASKVKAKIKQQDGGSSALAKRRCVSTACIACRRRKSKCDGNLPKCAACASVYMTECEYAPHTDHRRKGVYKRDLDSLRTKNSTLQTLFQAILNYDEDDVPELVRQIRTSDNLEELAAAVVAKEKGLVDTLDRPDSPVYGDHDEYAVPKFEAELAGKMGDLWLDGSVKFIGGTSNLIWLPHDSEYQESLRSPTFGGGVDSQNEAPRPREEAIRSWTTVTDDTETILHFLNMYFCWHYAYFTTLSKDLFYRDFLQGRPSQYCSRLLVNVMLALGCHFSGKPAARADPEDSATTGDHYFAEAKRLLYEDDEFASAKLCTVQALALMSVREAGCGRESKGWVYSGMSFRMAFDLGLNFDLPPINDVSRLRDEDIDARRITFWGCYLFDKCWSNYLGRQPQLQMTNITTKKPDVFAHEDAELWSPYTDAGLVHDSPAARQPARTRAVALRISRLAEISSDLLASFYHPTLLDRPWGRANELKKLSDLHTRLEAWKADLPAEMEPREGQLPQVLLMHMFFQLLYIHLYRPFLKYTPITSPLPAHVSPRKFCTQAAAAVSKLFRLYKRTHGLRQICNIAVYIVHSACTIHLLNLPDKKAQRDIVHGVRHLEEIGEFWTCARRTLRILNLCAEKWNIEIPDEAVASIARCRARWGSVEPGSSPSSLGVMSQQVPQVVSQTGPVAPRNSMQSSPQVTRQQQQQQQQQQPQPQPPQPNFPSVNEQLFGGYVRESYNSSVSTHDPPRSSTGVSPPLSSTVDLNRSDQRVRTPIHLTQAQQDAWNAHEATRRINNAGSSPSHPATTGAASKISTRPTASATQVFGGVESLIEENQDWWFNDQNSLALGFDNWTDMDWSAFGMGPGSTGSATSGNETQRADPSTAGSRGPSQYSFSDMSTLTGGFGAASHFTHVNSGARGQNSVEAGDFDVFTSQQRPTMSLHDVYY